MRYFNNLANLIYNRYYLFNFLDLLKGDCKYPSKMLLGAAVPDKQKPQVFLQCTIIASCWVQNPLDFHISQSAEEAWSTQNVGDASTAKLKQNIYIKKTSKNSDTSVFCVVFSLVLSTSIFLTYLHLALRYLKPSICPMCV